MNQAGFLHIPDSRYCFATGDHQLTIRLRMAKEDKDLPVYLIYGNKYGFPEKHQEVRLTKRYIDRLHAYYETELDLADSRLAYIFRIEEDGKSFYFSEDGITETYDFSAAYYDFFQMPYINQADVHRSLDWTKSAVFYQIFVDRFYQGDQEKDRGYINLSWGKKPNSKSFAGGDLEGIRQKLDYLQDLGVNVLYLTPIFQSISNHKYDISDYYAVDEHFGSAVSLKALIHQAHARGMKIILDAVFNHSSDRHPYFQDVVEKGRQSDYFDWYMIRGEGIHPKRINYETFASVRYMPKWNTSHPAVQAYLIDVGLYWIREFDIDGWRLDVSDEVSHDFWRLFRKAIKAEKPEAILIGENWHDAYPYLMGDQYDGIMNYAFTKACLDFFATGRLDAQGMAEQLNHILMRNTSQVNQMNLNLLDSHDTHRFFSQIGQSKDKLLAATALLMTFVGIPCLYYGTELAMEGGYDPDCRRCFNWDDSQWDQAFHDKMRHIIGLRQEKILQEGGIHIEADGHLLLLSRYVGPKEWTLIINLGPEASLEIDRIQLAHGLVENRLATNGFAIYKKERKD